ncbi:MAG: hypothetical protein OHK0045_24160 [Raineya sp.]
MEAIQNKELSEKVAQLQSTYEFKQKEIENNLLRKENKIKELEKIEALMLQKQQEQKNEILVSENNLLTMQNKMKESELEKEKLMRMEARTKAEKERKEKEILEKDALLKKQAIEKQEYIITGIAIIASLIALLAFGLGRAYLNRKRFAQTLQIKNTEIEQQKEEILTQRDLLNEQNKLLSYQKEEILASIRYAKNIQVALLPPQRMLVGYFEKFWAFYQPRDIVSGDFYYFTEHQGKAFLALADCTGHGVPGALMSSLGVATLENIIISKNFVDPALILNEINQVLYHSFKQEDTHYQNHDGMEVALCVIDKENKLIEFAGANRPLVLYKDESQIIEFMPTKQGVGGLQEDKRFEFEKQSITFEKSCKIYMFSDGYQDQFGGDKNKKIGKKRFLETLQKAILLPFEEQEKFLEKQFQEWRGSNEQVDDVSLIGAWVVC